jgi:hypothetical protein
MKPISAKQELGIRAAEALRSVLAELSAVKVQEIAVRQPTAEWPSALGRVDEPSEERAYGIDGLTASLEIYGRLHRLACEVAPDAEPARLRAALNALMKEIASRHAGATPMIIAPHLSAEAQDLCRQRDACFLDFDGNARIMLDEVFILKRSLPHTGERSVSHGPRRPAAHHTAA